MTRKASIRQGQSQRLSQGQRLALTPMLRTALGILRLNGFELEEMLLREAAENPVLHVSFRRDGGGDAYEAALRTAEARPSLVARVADQVATMRLPNDVRDMAMFLLAELEPDGMLLTPLSEIATVTGSTLDLAEAGLTALHACDPPGLGARDLAECLLLQLCDLGHPKELARQAIVQIDLFARHKSAELMRQLAIGREVLDKLAQDMRRLSPRPYQPVDDGNQAAPLSPDLIVERSPNGTLSVRLGQEDRVRIRIDPAFAEAASAPFAENRAKAEAMIRALEFRGATLLHIGRALLLRQPEYFTAGVAGLRPLSRADLAIELGLHPSTVGRAVTGKALAIDGTLVPLTAFFSAGLPAGHGEVAAAAVQHRILRMIEQETVGQPMSDEALCVALLADGVDISRRTVAKYRKCMRIPSSFIRRRRKAPRALSGNQPERPGL